MYVSLKIIWIFKNPDRNYNIFLCSWLKKIY